MDDFFFVLTMINSFQGVRVETAPEAGVRVLAEGKNLVLQVSML